MLLDDDVETGYTACSKAEELEQLRARARHYRAIIAGLCMRLRGERAWVRHLERIIEQQGRILDAYHLPRTVDK